MLTSGPCARILIVADLDYTHFNSSKPTPTWLGSKNAWLAFYQDITDSLQSQNIELFFAVVTNKPAFDDIAEEAAVAFKPLLQRGNPSMFIQHQGFDWCLVNLKDENRYECLSHTASAKAKPSLLSHFVVVPRSNKSQYIMNIARQYAIPASQCLVLDDTPQVIHEAKEAGFKTVAFEEFFQETVDKTKLDDIDYVEEYLDKKRREISLAVQTMAATIESQRQCQALHLTCPSFTPFFLRNIEGLSPMAAMQKYDPFDCLHSWGSFRLFCGR